MNTSIFYPKAVMDNTKVSVVQVQERVYNIIDVFPMASSATLLDCDATRTTTGDSIFELRDEAIAPSVIATRNVPHHVTDDIILSVWCAADSLIRYDTLHSSGVHGDDTGHNFFTSTVLS